MPVVNQIGPSALSIQVPDSPRVQANPDMAQGLLDVAREVDVMMKARAELRAKLQQAGDETLANPSLDFEAKVDAFKGKAGGVRATVKGSVPGRDGSRFEVEANRLMERQTAKVRAAAFRQEMPQRRERLMVAMEDLQQDFHAMPTAADRSRLRQNQRDLVQQHVEAGVLGADEAAAINDAFEARLEEQAVEDIAQRDPARALGYLDDGAALSYMTHQRRAEMRDGIEMDMRLSAAERAARLEASVGAVQSSLKTGALPNADVLADLEALSQEADNAPLKAAVTGMKAAVTTTRKMGRLPLEQAVQTLQDAETKATSKEEAEALRAFGPRLLRDMKTALETDPLGFAVTQGVADMEPLDWNEAGPDAFRDRARQARMIANFYGLPKTTYLTAEERGRLGSAFGAAAPERKAQLLQAVGQAFGAEDGPAVFNEIDGVAPVDAHLARLGLQGGGREDVARRGFIGQQLLKDKAVTLPDDQSFGAVESEEIGTLFDARMGAARGKVIATARALYAERAVNHGSNGFDEAAYREALQAALGKGRDGGGPATWNGRRVVLPADMTEATLREHMQGLQDADLASISASKRKPVHVSLSGKVVPATADDLRKAVLVQAGYGRYRVSMTDPATGMGQFLADEGTGSYYEIDLSDPARRPARLVQTFEGGGGRSGGGAARVERVGGISANDTPKAQDRLLPGGN